MSAYARHALLPPARGKKKSKSSMTGTALRSPLRSLSPIGQIRKTQTNMWDRDSFSQPSSDGSMMKSQPKVLPFEGHGTRQYKRNGSIPANFAPSREIVYSEEPMSQLTDFSHSSSAQSISHDSIVNHPELNQRSVASRSSNTSTSISSKGFSFVRRGLANVDASLKSKASSIPLSHSWAKQSAEAPRLSNGDNLQALAMPSRKATRPWMNGWSSKTSFMSKATPVEANGFALEYTPFLKESDGSRNGVLGTSSRWTADSSIKFVKDDTSSNHDGESSEAKSKALITHHFKPVVFDKLKSPPGSDVKALHDDGMTTLNEKQRELEKLAFDIDTKLKAFDETSIDGLANKQRELEKLASEIDTKMRTFDEMTTDELARYTEVRKRLEKESDQAIQRVNKASIDAVETVKRASQSGVDALTSIVAEARDVAAQAKRKILQEIKQTAKRLVPSLFDNKVVACASSPEYGAMLSSHERYDGSKTSFVQSREVSVPPVDRVKNHVARMIGSAKNRDSSQTAALMSKRAGMAETPGRPSKRLKSRAAARSPKVSTPVRNSKFSCVTPSVRSASNVVPPDSVAFACRASTKKRHTKTDSTCSKTIAERMPDTKHAMSRGRKKPRTTSSEEEAQLSWTVSDSDSSSTSLSQASSGIIVSPAKKRVSRPAVGRTSRRRTYSRLLHVIETSLVDDFSFLSSD